MKKNAPAGCGCCCVVTNIRDNSWTGWVTPPSPGNVITAGNTTTYTHLLPGNDFTVDIEVTDVNDSFDSIFRAGRQGAVIADISSTTKIGIALHRCQYTTVPVTGTLWLRIQEATIATNRRLSVEVWDRDPNLVARVLIDSFCGEGEPDDPEVEEVTIELTAGDTDVTIGVVRVSATSESFGDCPEISCTPVPCNVSGPAPTFYLGPPTHIVTAVRCVVTGLGIESTTVKREFFDGFCGVTTFREQTLEVDFSVLNGTYQYHLRYQSGATWIALTAGEQNAVLNAVANGVCTPLPIEAYRWWPSTLDLKQIGADAMAWSVTDTGDCQAVTFNTPADSYPSGNSNNALWKPLDQAPTERITGTTPIINTNQAIWFEHNGNLAALANSFPMYRCAENSAVSNTWSRSAIVNDTSYSGAGNTITYNRDARSQTSTLEFDYVYR